MITREPSPAASETTRPPAHDAVPGALTSAFLKTLVSLVRAEDSHGVWDKRSDTDLVRDFVVDKQARRSIPIVGDPGPDVLHRVELFYRAVALRIEQCTGVMASPMMTMSHEGFGRVILTAGKLVALSRTLRDVHRFGFDNLDVLERDGEKAVATAAAAIASYPAVARS